MRHSGVPIPKCFLKSCDPLLAISLARKTISAGTNLSKSSTRRFLLPVLSEDRGQDSYPLPLCRPALEDRTQAG